MTAEILASLWILDDEGRAVNPADFEQYAAFMADPERRRIDEDTLAGGTWISTVFLGVDPSFGLGPPVLWETMVFGHDGDPLDCERYTSAEAARAGHCAHVAKWRAAHRLFD